MFQSSHWNKSRCAGSERKSSRSRHLGLEPLEERWLLTLLGNQLLPTDSPWNRSIAAAPVAANSATLINSIGATARVHPDFGTVYQGGMIGIPFNVVSGTQPKVDVVIDAYADESDLLQVPIPAGAVIEGDPLPSSDNDGDRHLMVYDRDNNVVYELFNAHRPSETSDNKWHADSEAFWDLKTNYFRTPGDTSADAAGLPILPGLVRPDEVLDQGVINHALRFTVPRSANSYVFPASHQAGSNNASLPRMGERFRLKQDFDISSYPATDRVILQALKDYGMIVADNGSAWYISGEPSTRWNDDILHSLGQISGSAFEAVDLRPTLTSLDQTSGSTAGGTAVTVHGHNFSGNAGQLKVLFGTTQATNVTITSDTTLVVIAPAHAAGVVDIKVQTPYGTSAVSNADRFTYTAATGSSVQQRLLYYANSYFASPANNSSFSHDTAIATDKAALLPGGGQATFNNVSSYTQGINGIMIDLSAGGTHGSIVAGDFSFKTSGPGTSGATNSPSTWTTLATAPTITVRPGAGAGGSDRVELTWANGAILDTWLQVTVKANVRTGLPANDVFYFGSHPGESGNDTDPVYRYTDVLDESSIRAHGGLNGADLFQSFGLSIAIQNRFDVNRDNQVDVLDQSSARFNAMFPRGELDMISIPSGGPFAPVAPADEQGWSAVIAGLAGGVPRAAFGVASSMQSIEAPANMRASQYQSIETAPNQSEVDSEVDTGAGDALLADLAMRDVDEAWSADAALDELVELRREP